jgi:predicted permease
MRLWRHAVHGLRVLTRRARADHELDEELRHYIDEATESYVARGLTPDDARRRAQAETGSAVRIRERVRDHGWERWVTSWTTDIRLAARALRKTPIFTAVVVLVVSLGSGAVATVFSAMNAIVLRPVAGVDDPSTLVTLQPARPDGGTAEQISYARYAYLRGRAHGVDGLAAWGRVTLTIAGDGPGVTVLGNLVTAEYFDVLGIRPARGRFFAPGEADTPGGQPVLVVSDAFWRTRLGADPAAVGRTVTVNGQPFTLIGVAPAAFRGLYTGLVFDAWAPVTMQPQLRPRSNLTGATWLWAFARLRGGVEPAAVARELTALVGDHRRDTGAPDDGDAAISMRATPLTGLPGGTGGMLGFLGVLLAAAALVLVIAGVNVAALLSARYAVRSRDLAVRAALGAGRMRLIRQLLTEVGLLFVLGAAGGFAVAAMATAALERLPLPGTIPVTLEISPDLRVLAFALALALGSGIVFGLAPALQGAKKDIVTRLRVASPGSGIRRSRTGRVLVAGQLALSLVLLVAAGLFARAVDRGARVDPGFDVRGVTTVAFEPEAWGYDGARSRAFYQALRERLAAEPGVTAVSYSQRLPLMFSRTTDTIALAGATRSVDSAAIDPGYFEALKLPLLRGRPVLASDGSSAPRVAVVNETLARAIAPDGAAIGATFRFRDADTTVVGVARDAKYASLDEPTPAFVYVPLAQVEQPRRALLVRAEGRAMDAAIVRAVQALDPAIPPPPVSTLERDTQIALLPQRAAAIVTGALGALGLVLAALGLYGTIAASASRRTREIGVRLALGARPGQVVRALAGEGLRLAAAGVMGGLLLAGLATPLLRRWLFGVSPLDVTAYAAAAGVFLLVALLASALPARRAAAVDPLRSLRTD